jgi:hypothetical protein
MTGFVIRLIRRIPHVEKELLTFSEHLSAPRFVVEFVLLVFCISFWSFSFGHCIVCPFFDIRLLITHRYLQICLLKRHIAAKYCLDQLRLIALCIINTRPFIRCIHIHLLHFLDTSFRPTLSNTIYAQHVGNRLE